MWLTVWNDDHVSFAKSVRLAPGIGEGLDDLSWEIEFLGKGRPGAESPLAVSPKAREPAFQIKKNLSFLESTAESLKVINLSR